MKPGVVFDPCSCQIHRDDCDIHRTEPKPVWVPLAFGLAASQLATAPRNPIKDDRAVRLREDSPAQLEMDKVDPTLYVRKDGSVLNVYDSTRWCSQLWAVQRLPNDWVSLVAGYFSRRRALHPESYATCKCHLKVRSAFKTGSHFNEVPPASNPPEHLTNAPW